MKFRNYLILVRKNISDFFSYVRRQHGARKVFLISGLCVAAFLLFIFLVDINFLWLFGKSPRIRDINNPKYEITSELYSADSVLIGKYFDVNRTPVTYNQISPLLIKTLIATEDARFYQHHGIDIKASFSVFYYMIKGEKRGGSTITQQLVKNLFKTRSNYSKGLFGYIPLVRVLIYKTKELINAIKIELFYSKEDILTMYLNTVDFGSNTFGIKTAAKAFFNVTPDKLSIEQCATLVGMLKAPSYYSPISHRDRSTARRNVVFSQMCKYNLISKSYCDSLSKLPLIVDPNFEENYDGMAVYFRSAVARYLEKWLEDNDYDLYRDGLKIYTTIDSRMQQYAEESAKENMRRLQKQFNQQWQGKNPWIDESGNELPGFIENNLQMDAYYKQLKLRFGKNTDSINYYLNIKRKIKVFTLDGVEDTTFSHMDSLIYYKKFLHSGFIAMDPTDGQVKAWLGDIDFRYFKFDHVDQSKRQPGSTFKAFLYTAAIDNGYAPCDKKIDMPVSVEYMEDGKKMVWAPQNASRVFTHDTMTLKYAFARSVNSIAVQLTKELGWEKVIEYAHKLGITSDLKKVPSVAIGSSDVSLLELVNAYCPLVNGGYHVQPLLVTRIEDKDGHVIKEFAPVKERVISEETSFLMTQMLRGGLTEPRGTTQALFSYDLFRSKIEIGGKTGTSQNNSDGWFVGVSPKLIGGAWVGGEQRSIHFKGTMGEGLRTALPLFGTFMEKVLKDEKFDFLKVRFDKPSVKITKNYSCHTILRREATLPDSLKNDTLAPQ
jgi:penicillin-binding protein 1A